MATIQLQELIPVETPLGFGYAIIFETGEHEGLENGTLVTFTQDKLRLSRSYTHGRGISDEEMKKIVGG